MDFRRLLIVTLTAILLSGLLGAGTASAQDPVVETVTPSSAVQGTSLEVEIVGRNFGRGAVVYFMEPGTSIQNPVNAKRRRGRIGESPGVEQTGGPD